MNKVQYSQQRGYRVDLPNGQAYTTNPDGSGLFFHDGRGGRVQVQGNAQFYARSLRDFRAQTREMVAVRLEIAAEVGG